MPKRTKAIKSTDRKAQKAWLRKAKSSRYPVDEVEPYETILIVCEGHTEELYFKSFPVYAVTVYFENTEGQSKRKLIEIAKKKIDESNITFDQVWCVFDMDVKEGKKEYADFDNAIESGKSQGFNVAYSNDAFELWFYLHYQYAGSPEHRSFYYRKLGEYWKINYAKKGKKVSFARTIYAKLQSDPVASQKKAIRRAKELHNKLKYEKYHRQNPVTTVYELVEFLNKNRRK